MLFLRAATTAAALALSSLQTAGAGASRVDAGEALCGADQCRNEGRCSTMSFTSSFPASSSSGTSFSVVQLETCECPAGFVGLFCEREGPGIGGDHHMIGFHGQKIDWKGRDGAWYAIVSDGPDLQMSVRVTAPLAEEFPDIQLITGFALKYEDGHSIVIETNDPYTTQTGGCPDGFAGRCLAENSLKITVDGEGYPALPVERAPLPGRAHMTALNLPAECQPYGSDITFTDNSVEVARRQLSTKLAGVEEWVSGWSPSTALPLWCDRFVSGSGAGNLLNHQSKHAVFQIATTSLAVRLHHGTNHQEEEVLEDGRVIPTLEFWQMGVHIEWLILDSDHVTGLLGETMRPVLDDDGAPILTTSKALRGEVADYRISDPLASDFDGVQT